MGDAQHPPEVIAEGAPALDAEKITLRRAGEHGSPLDPAAFIGETIKDGDEIWIVAASDMRSPAGLDARMPGFLVTTSVALALPRRLLSSAYLKAARRVGGGVERRPAVAGSGVRRPAWPTFP